MTLLMDFRLEVVQVPVSDVDRAKRFYTENVGSTLTTTPGSVEGLQLTVTDMDAARSELVDRGVEVSDVEIRD